MSSSNPTNFSSFQRVAINTLVPLAVILSVLGTMIFAYLIRNVLLQLILATFLSLMLLPVQRWFRKRGVNRSFAAVIAVLLTLFIIFAVVGAIISPLITQGSQLVKNAPHLLDKFSNNSLLHTLNTKYHFVSKLRKALADAPMYLIGNQRTLLNAVSSIVGTISNFALIMIMSLFILIEGPDIWAKIIRFLGPKNGRQANKIADQVSAGISGFVSGNLLISVIAAVIAYATLSILRVPYPLALAAFVAVFDLIPLIGAGLATVVLGLVALTQGVWPAITIITVMLIYQFIEGHFIQPAIYSRTVKLSQLTILIASIIGAELGGILGILLAIPAASIVSILLSEIYAFAFHNY